MVNNAEWRRYRLIDNISPVIHLQRFNPPQNPRGKELRRSLMERKANSLKSANATAGRAHTMNTEEDEKALTKPIEPFRFKDLPAELRKRIYHFAMEPRHDYTAQDGIWYFYADARPPIKDLYPRLVQVSKQIAQEVIAVFFDHHTLIALIGKHRKAEYEAFLASTATYDLSCVRNLHIEDYQVFHHELRKDAKHPDLGQNEKHQKLCHSRLEVDVANVRMPVRYLRDPRCKDCPLQEEAVDRVAEVVRETGQQLPSTVLTKEKLMEMFRAAAWPTE